MRRTVGRLIPNLRSKQHRIAARHRRRRTNPRPLPQLHPLVQPAVRRPVGQPRSDGSGAAVLGKGVHGESSPAPKSRRYQLRI